MAKEYAQAFYHSQAWKNTRDAYYKLQRGMCERCTKELAEGRITLKDVEPGIIVHHKKHITPENINNPRVTLSFDNLELLCARHHNEEHKSKYEKRYRFDEYGNIIQIEHKEIILRHSTPRGAHMARRPRNRGSNLNFTPQGRAQ